MVLEALTPRHSLPVGLLALIPVAWFGFGRSATSGFVAAVNVILILACLYVAFTPVPDHHDHGSNGTSP
ncbi:cytochrome-ba3 oxidase subunit [Natronolimnobius baerhuensis]|uniref:Cytochrome-ba3 oxidase subunit n=1 Tax=Natronolimnobius baerhuensis TaxID=253108 RepID=A0A202E4C0_9EURY|nr:cytochrome-ba3 oxidase subunit [Natronolimnobius baerhuensis]OVE83079.1 cytochrome-ba3 oxidase subunit [Natronolimnobius baerhuensis]